MVYLTRLAITFFVLHSRRSCRVLLTRSRRQEKSVNVSTPSCKGYSSIFNEEWKNKTKCIGNIKVFEFKILNMVYRKTMLILPPKRLELLESSSSVATAWNDFFLFIFCSVARLFLNNKVKNQNKFSIYFYFTYTHPVTKGTIRS